MTFGHRVASAVLALAPALAAAQAQQTSPLDAPAFTAAPAELRAAAAKIPAQPFADVTVLSEQEHYTLAADGRLTRRHTLLYRVETRAGVDEWSRTSVEWDPWYQAQPTIKARVLSPEGRTSELDPATLTDVPAKNEEDDTFSDARIHKGPLPSVGPGAIVEEETTVTDKQPFFTGGSAYRVYFARSVPVVHSRMIVEVPAEASFQARPHFIPASSITSTTDAGIRRTTYDLTSVPLARDSDIDLASDESTKPFLEFSTGASWASVAAAYQQLAEPQIKQDQARPTLPAPAPAQDYLANIQAIVSRLHKEVRYTGIEFGESALKPQTPAEILKRHYGDCKDKAAFLVAMLRASGIPASLALLQTGPGADVNPDLPGMNQFDHAIVHVPAGGPTPDPAKPELWIDATAEYTHVGDLPYMDEGRLALIIADGTTALTRTPDPKPGDSVLVETRDFTLPSFGKAHVLESSATTGQVDADYRYRYGAAISKPTHDDLEKYATGNYYARRLVAIDHTNGTDMATPFLLKLDIADAARGTVTLSDAAVGIRVSNLLNALPGWFFDEPAALDAKLTPEQLEDRGKAERERLATYQLRPYIAEWHYNIHVPAGFAARALPEDQTLQLGPATLTRHFAATPSLDAPTLVTANFRFDTGKPRYTTDEVLALRKAVLELARQNNLVLQFDQSGARLFAAGNTRQALAADRALIAAAPSDPIHHTQFSTVLLSAGLGDQAQAQARLATTLDAKSAIAFYQLGLALESNSIGVHFGKGFDRKGALAAYRRAVELEPDNVTYLTQLAVLDEHNNKGERYAADADLAGAVREYRKLPAIDKEVATNFEDNLLYDLLYNRQYAELLAELKPLPTNPTRDAMSISALAATSVPAALKRADLVAGTTEKSAALRLSGIQLMRLGLYPQCGELLQASLLGQTDAAQLGQQAEIFRSLQHVPDAPAAGAKPDARVPVSMMLTSMTNGTLGQSVPLFLDRHAFATDAEWQKNIDHNEAANIMDVISQSSGLPAAVMRDLILGRAKITTDGDDTHGYHATLQTLGANPESFFISRDGDAGYRIVAASSDNAEVGNYAVYLLAQHREVEARSLLDWKRDLVHRGGGDDPLAGPLFPRFWAESSSTLPAGDPAASPDAIQIAALALSLTKPATRIPLAPALAAASKSPANGDLQLLLAEAYLNLQDGTSAQPFLDKLLAQYPDSLTVLSLAGREYLLTHNNAAWKSLLDARLTRRPNDPDLLRQAAYQAEAAGDFAAARKSLQRIVDNGKATAADYNGLSWSSLFDDTVDAKAIEAARQSNTMTKNTSWPELHTLACLYAAQGKTTEARQLLLQVMSSQNLAEPSSAVWLGFGLIDEQFGDPEAAIAAYKKVTPPDQQPTGPTDNYTLAQLHLKALHAL